MHIVVNIYIYMHGKVANEVVLLNVRHVSHTIQVNPKPRCMRACVRVCVVLLVNLFVVGTCSLWGPFHDRIWV